MNAVLMTKSSKVFLSDISRRFKSEVESTGTKAAFPYLNLSVNDEFFMYKRFGIRESYPFFTASIANLSFKISH